ncbi:MAG TPA: hypothetical protein VKE22_03725 [Haliangiales bacterium]|nr:hypothetical protein [Haliangiales bacterium]
MTRLSPAAIRGLADFLALGPSLVLGTCDETGKPEVVRCGAARVTPDGRLRILVPMPEGRRSVANLTATGRGALAAALASNYRTVQVKGRDAALVRWPEHHSAAQEHLAAFGAQHIRAGVPGELHLAMWSRRFTVVDLTPEELFDQPPGPTAGHGVPG